MVVCAVQALKTLFSFVDSTGTGVTLLIPKPDSADKSKLF